MSELDDIHKEIAELHVKIATYEKGMRHDDRCKRLHHDAVKRQEVLMGVASYSSRFVEENRRLKAKVEKLDMQLSSISCQLIELEGERDQLLWDVVASCYVREEDGKAIYDHCCTSHFEEALDRLEELGRVECIGGREYKRKEKES